MKYTEVYRKDLYNKRGSYMGGFGLKYIRERSTPWRSSQPSSSSHL